MSKQIFSLLMTVLLSVNISTFAQTKTEKLEVKNKSQILDLGTNQHVNLKLVSGETMQGRITEIKPDSFTVQFVDLQNQIKTRELAYREVAKISSKKDSSTSGSFKKGLGTGLGIYAGIFIGGLIAVGIVTLANK